MKIGIIREGKVPPDSRVPMNPKECAFVQNKFPVEIAVQSSPNRCFPDKEFKEQGVKIVDDVADCEVLMGVKEVPIDKLIPYKTYFFFSHTIKKQSYNKKLLQAILQKNIRLIDYEVLTNEKGKRLIAFGKFAGMVGAHNALYTWGKRTSDFDLKRMKDCFDYAEAKAVYKTMKWPPIKIVLTGHGRVGTGAKEVLLDMGIRQVSPEEYLNKNFDEIVFTQLKCKDYAARKDGNPFVKSDFYQKPELFKSIFQPYAKVSNIMINGIYWDNNAPAFFTKEEMKTPDFNIKVIADVTCDIAPISSIPSTLKASTIADPIFGYNPKTASETTPFQEEVIDMMTIDNLPNEMPRDASTAFGKQFIDHILPELLKEESSVIERATVAKNGDLGKHFEYLRSWLNS